MKVAVFLLTLCLVLMGGADRVFAGAHSKGCCYARTYHHEMMQDIKKKVPQPDPALTGLATISTEDSFFILEGFEEEDVDETLSRKFRMAGKFYELLFLQSDLHDPDHLFKALSSIFRQGSEKYIFQRVFRV